MIQKMDVIIHFHQKHQAKVHSSLENITPRLENIETRLSLGNLLNPDEDEAKICSCAYLCCFVVFLSVMSCFI